MHDSNDIYTEGICDACLQLLSESPIMVSLYYPGEDPLYFHRDCYEAIAALLPPPPPSNPNFEEKRRLWHLQVSLRHSSPEITSPDLPI